MAARSLSFAVILALIYGLFGIAWVAGSDAVLAMLVSDPDHMTAIQTWKGMAFVIASAVLIYGVGIRLLRAIEQSEYRYRLLFADSPEALALYDPKTLRIVEINAAAGLMFGYEPSEAQDLVFTDLMPLSSRVSFEREGPHLLDGQKSGGIWRMCGKDGRLVDVSSHGQTVAIHGRTLRLVQLVDVTARLRAEYELLRTLEGLGASNERMRELSHALSHDLQEPLRQVSGFVQLLAKRYDGQLDAEAHQFIGFAVEGIHRLKTLIGDVERFALNSDFVPNLVDTRRVVSEVIDGLRGAMDNAGATITVGQLPCILADPNKLAVVFHALLDNAIKFRRPGHPPEIAVEARGSDGCWLFRVSDNGIGIEPEFRDGVFSLFRRLHTREHIPGNGAGLALARKLVEAHGGRIWVETSPSGGATLCFTLPDTEGRGGESAGQH